MILIVEDNKDVNHMLAEALSQAGFETKSVYSGTDGAKEAKKGECEMILLDMMLPYMSGDEVIKSIRKESQVPIIVVSAKDMTSTKVDMLRLGADDYITKPFDLSEVVARIESILRRVDKKQSPAEVISYKNMTLDENAGRIELAGRTFDCTLKEYKILELLLKNRDKVFTKAKLYELVWGEEYFEEDSLVKTHISNLRSKIKKADPDTEYIETVWGIGYRLYR